ncbi:MAG: DUF721 domain-containing protein [Nitrospirota bacterium]|nr:DUF721 domain-containing protein [Nitrospirota bacterium]
MRSRKIELVSRTIEKLLAARGWSSRLKEYRVLGIWDRCVGASIAAHAQPVMIRGKKLTVIVDSSAWMQQISLLRPEIMEKLNRSLGEEAVESIALKLGEMKSSGSGNEGRKIARRSLNAEERKRIEEYVQGIGDEDVRDRLKHLIEKDLASKKPSSSRN